MGPSEAIIAELNLINDIEKMENTYTGRTGLRPIKLSHWNPSPAFKLQNKTPLLMDEYSNIIDYIFSYNVKPDIQDKLLKKLGFLHPEKRGCLYTHAGSASIFNIMNFLRNMGINKLHLVCPSYFTVRHAANACSIEYVNHYFKRDSQGGYCLPTMPSASDINKNEAVWFTNPVYCTSVYYSSNEISYIKKLLDEEIQVVIDESLAITGKYLAGKFGNYLNFTGIYSPHKSICVNGNKFSLVVFDKENQSLYDSWSDVLCGCLSTGNMVAISHYLSDNFTQYESEFTANINANFNAVKRLCHKYSVEYDNDANGYLVTIYFRNIPAQKGWDVAFLSYILNEVGCTFIPGSRNHFDDSVGFCFRLNLAAWSTEYSFGLERCIKLLSRL